MLRILLADDHLIVRQGLRVLLERTGFEIVGEAADGEEAVRLARAQCPDVAVLDFAMPLLNGLDAAREICQACPGTRAILLTMHTEDRYVHEALRGGVRGYVVKSQATEDLVHAIQDVSRDLTYLSSRVSRTVVQAYLGAADPSEPLTPRELEVLRLVAEGKRTREVADVLGISLKTAEAHRTRVMKKLETHNTAGMVRYAIRQGLIEA